MSGELGKASPDKQSEISREMESLAKVTEGSCQALGDLEARLSPILRASPICEKEKEPEETLVLLADEIRKIRKRVNTLGVRITDIRQRVEL